MPELPEVETVRRDLARVLLGLPIVEVQALHAKTIRPLTAAQLTKKLAGQSIKTIDRIGKLLILEFSGIDEVILVHLKMTGQLIYQAGEKILAGGHSLAESIATLPNKHTRVIVTFKNGAQLFFNDLRLFGYWKIIDRAELVAVKNGYGIEPLTPNFTWSNFKQVVAGRKTVVKALLLNQTIISGLGNIYVDEALWRAQILPSRRVDTLSEKELKKLWQACHEVIELGVKHRGTTFNHFVDGHGQKGGFLQFLEVYGRKGQPCSRCGTLIKKVSLAGRGTHFCPQCQV